MLHLWSLGVELQFYLIVPLILWLRRKLGVWVIPAMILASMIVCAGLVLINPKSAFLLMPARIWEFGFGMWAAQLGKGVARKQTVGLVAAIGIVILMFAPFLFERLPNKEIRRTWRQLNLCSPGTSNCRNKIRRKTTAWTAW